MNQSEQQQNIDKLNQLLEQANNSLSCGPDCMKIRTEQELRQKYIDAQMNIETAPIELEDSKRNYYVFTEGDNYYNNMLETELKNKATELTKVIKTTFNEQVNNAKMINDYYNSQLVNSENTIELYNKYENETRNMEQNIKNQYGDILTNNRKTYYSSEALERVKLWYKFMWYIYYILVIVLILGFFLAQSETSKLTKLIIIIIMLVYPYIIDPIVKLFYNQFKKINKQLPKSVYNNI